MIDGQEILTWPTPTVLALVVVSSKDVPLGPTHLEGNHSDVVL